MTDLETEQIKRLAHEILRRIEGRPVGYVAAIHAATVAITSMAIEQSDPITFLDGIIADMRAEAVAMIGLIHGREVHDA